MAEIIPEVLSEKFQDLMEGRVLKTGVFLTFSFDPGFFEQEILPVFIDVPLSHLPAVRLIQLEDAIRERVDHLAVYYDPRAVEAGSEGGKLDVKRIPVLWRTGYFHPKNVLLLVEDAEPDGSGLKERRLLVGTLSANLTRSGWWENVEVCHVEELRTSEKSSLGGDLQQLCARLRRAAAREADHAALSEIERFLRGVPERLQRTSNGRLNPRLYVGAVDGRGAGQSVPEFLDDVLGTELLGTRLEVISPFLDDTGEAGTLLDLVERFEPEETRVYLPLGPDGTPRCGKAHYDAVRGLSGVSWAKLPASLLRSSSDESAVPRRVHAKVYRFFRTSPRYEALFVGSVNLTSAAHRKGGNFETAFLIEPDPGRPPDWWMTVDRVRPDVFEEASEEDEASSQGLGVALALRYSWDSGRAEAYWEGRDASPPLDLESAGARLFTLGPLPAGEWVTLEDGPAGALRDVLPEASVVTVKIEGEEPARILVQEVGMAHKPSILLNLSVADILKCWAALTPDQKAILLEERYEEISTVASALVPKAPLGRLESDTLFDAFAGIFHAFGSLERRTLQALGQKRWNEAVHLLFGNKYDSLPHLLGKVLEPPAEAADGSGGGGPNGEAESQPIDDVNAYVILLCARQLLDRIREEAPETFRIERQEDLRRLEGLLMEKSRIESRLDLGTPESKAEFLRWFESWFLRRAAPVEVESQ